MTEAMPKFYIMDTRQVVGNCVLWWCPDGAGYTTQLEEAGLYEHSDDRRPTDVEVPEDLARACGVTHVRIELLRDEMDKRGLQHKAPKPRRKR